MTTYQVLIMTLAATEAFAFTSSCASNIYAHWPLLQAAFLFLRNGILASRLGVTRDIYAGKRDCLVKMRLFKY